MNPDKIVSWYSYFELLASKYLTLFRQPNLKQFPPKIPGWPALATCLQSCPLVTGLGRQPLGDTPGLSPGTPGNAAVMLCGRWRVWEQTRAAVISGHPIQMEIVALLFSGSQSEPRKFQGRHSKCAPAWPGGWVGGPLACTIWDQEYLLKL